MRYLFYSSSAIHKIAIGILSDDAEKLVREGHEVYFVTCGGIVDNCAGNTRCNSGICKVCKLWTNIDLSKLNKKIKRVNLNDYKSYVKESYELNFKNADELRNLSYKNVLIGLGAMSSYIDQTRNQKPAINDRTKRYFDYILSVECSLTDIFYKIIEDISPDHIYLYNGRFLEYRPLYDIAITKEIPLTSMEVIPDIDTGDFYKMYTYNCLPQDIKSCAKRVYDLWEKSDKNDEEKIRIAKSFYENKRNKLPAGDKIYTKNQNEGFLPDGWNKEKINITIFNSSDDEYAALGGEFDDLLLFRNQIEGIRYLLKTFNDDKRFYFYLRIHPNLARIKYKYHTELLSLDKEFDNITIIPANNPVDTYALMDASDKIVVYGSTMGIESVYWGKPVILLAASFYYYQNIAYIPKTKNELTELIAKDLKPKFNDFVYKYGYYVMDYTTAVADNKQYSYIDFSLYRMSIGKFKAWGANYQKIFGSKRLLLLIVSFLRVLLSSIYRDKFEVPLEEE